MRLWIPWSLDALVALVALGFFMAGVSDGTVSSFSIRLWLGLLGGLAAVVGGSLWLRAKKQSALAIGVALLLALPALLAVLLFVVLIVSHPRWN